MLKNNNSLKKIFPIFITGIIICLFTYIGFMYNKYIIDTNNLKAREENISELEWIFIKSIIYEDYLAATNQAKSVAENITFHILNDYPDLNQLKNEFDHPEQYPNPRYMEIMEFAIKDQYLFGIENDDNDIFICNKYGIIYDNSDNMKTRLSNIPQNQKATLDFNHSSIYSWKNVYDRSMNPVRTKKIINSILRQSQDILFLEHLAVNANTEETKHYILTKNATLNDLYILYQQNGINAFKNIQFLAPAYITPTGDIFGTEDISIYGEKNNNYKIIVVQTFNLYQQLMNRYPGEIFKFDTLRNNIITSPLQDINIHALFIIMIITIVSILIIFFMFFIEKYKNINDK